MSLHFLVLAVLSFSRIVAGLIQSEAVCAPTFTWSQNAKSQSPCLVSAYVSGACGTNTWNVPALTSGNHYDPPDTKTATACTCSWAAYNLLSACTACQGLDDSVPNWDSFKQGCVSGGLLSNDTYFPANITLTSDTAIPYWAGTDPSTWPDHHFNVAQAKSIAGQAHPDLGTPTKPKKSKTQIGPIVGGVVGGVVFLALVGVAIIYYVRWQRKRRAADYRHRPEGITNLGRSISILSRQSGSTPLTNSGISPAVAETSSSVGQTPSAPGLSHAPTSPTTHGHSSSSHSISYFSSAHGSSSPPGRQPSLALAAPLSREQIIEPYFSGPQARPETHVRKHSASTVRSVYEGPSLLPAVIGLDGRAVGSTPPEVPRARVNPPAYSANPGDGDTTVSSDLTGQGDATVGHGTPRREKGHLNSRTRRGDSAGGRRGASSSATGTETTTESTSDNAANRPISHLSVANPDQQRNDVA